MFQEVERSKFKKFQKNDEKSRFIFCNVILKMRKDVSGG
jgi:hypothetical protein